MRALTPFGPLIYQGDTSEEFLKFLLEGVDRSRNGSDMRSSLAGNMSEEKSALYDPKNLNLILIFMLEDIYFLFMKEDVV